MTRSLLVRDVAQAFLVEMDARTELDGRGRRRRSKQTVRAYRAHLGRWLDQPFYVDGREVVLAELPITDVDTPTLRSLLSVVMTTPTRYGTDPAPNTVRNVQSTLGAMCEWAEIRYGLRGFTNPTRGLDLGRRVLERSVRPVKDAVYLTGDGADLIAAVASRIYRPLIEFINSTGARSGEARGVRWGDLHLDEQFPFVRLTVQADIDGNPVENLKHRAPGEYRDVPLPVEEVKRLRERRKKLGRVSGETLVFPTVHGRARTSSNLTKAIGTFAARAGFEGVTAHVLRDAYARRLIAAGVDIASVSKLLGHRDVSTTVDAYLDAEPPLEAQAQSVALAFGLALAA